jgi:hypothetical protein
MGHGEVEPGCDGIGSADLGCPLHQTVEMIVPAPTTVPSSRLACTAAARASALAGPCSGTSTKASPDDQARRAIRTVVAGSRPRKIVIARPAFHPASQPCR